MLMSCDPSYAVRVFVLDGGIVPEAWERLRARLASCPPNVTLERLPLDLARFRDMSRDFGHSHMAYARLMLPEMMTEERIVYADSDFVFQKDVSTLARVDLAGHVVGACPDLLIQTMGRGGYDCDALGLDPDAAYFNSGLMVMDLKRWRDLRVSETAIAHLEKHGASWPYWDQGALNVTLYERWQPVETSWNYPSLCLSDGGNTSGDGLNVHFVGPRKPWIFETASVPGARLFHRYKAEMEDVLRAASAGASREGSKNR